MAKVVGAWGGGGEDMVRVRGDWYVGWTEG